MTRDNQTTQKFSFGRKIVATIASEVSVSPLSVSMILAFIACQPATSETSGVAKERWINPTNPEGALDAPVGEVRGVDTHGSGAFGASRGRRTHRGADYIAIPDQSVSAVIDGRITKLGYVYDDNPFYRFVEITSYDNDYVVRQFYVQPSTKKGAEVKAGQPIGIYQGLSSAHPGITEHVHVEIRHKDKVIDPTLLIPEP